MGVLLGVGGPLAFRCARTAQTRELPSGSTPEHGGRRRLRGSSGTFDSALQNRVQDQIAFGPPGMRTHRKQLVDVSQNAEKTSLA